MPRRERHGPGSARKTSTPAAVRGKLRGLLCAALLLSTTALTGAPPDAPVADAAQRGDLEAVRELLRDGADVNAAQGDGMTALHWAAIEGRAEMAEVLIYAGAHLEATTRLGSYTPLHLAAKAGHVEAVVRLLEAGSDAEAATSTGATALHLAARAGTPGAVNALVAHGADVNAREGGADQTPLMWAAATGRLSTVDALIAAGADVGATSEVVDFAARSEADRAAARRRREVMAAIQKAEAEARGETVDEDAASDEDRAGRVNPGEAAREARQEGEPAQAADSTAAAGDEGREAAGGEAADAEPSGEDPVPAEPSGEDPVPAEASGEDPAPDADPLDAAPADEEPGEDEASGEEADEEEDEDSGEPALEPLSYDELVGSQGGLSALHYAVREGRTEVVRSLLAAGADIDEPTGGDHSTPLVIAAVNGHYDLLLELLSMGADPNVASEDGVAPLYAVIANRWAPKALYPQPTAFKQQHASYLETMETLLQAGADPNARVKTHIWYASYNFDLLGVNFMGATPFWRAAYALDVPAMELLVAHGADPSIPTQKPPERRRRYSDDEEEEEDPSGLPPVEVGGPGIPAIVAAAGVGYGRARAGNSHRYAPDSWLAAAKYLVEELGADVNARDHDGFSALHYAAARGDNELIEYLVSQGADPTVVARSGQTTVDMANGPIQRVQPFPETIALLEGMGAKNNDNCVSC